MKRKSMLFYIIIGAIIVIAGIVIAAVFHGRKQPVANVQPYDLNLLVQERDQILSEQQHLLLANVQRITKEAIPIKASTGTPMGQGKSNQPEQEKCAYLTFDDGASENTVIILDTLKQYGVQATFFITGTGNPDLVRRIHDEGHVIGNHTFSHNYAKIYRTPESFWQDFEEEERFLKEITGSNPTLIRFPGGSNNTVSYQYGGSDIMKKIIEQAKAKDYQYYDWNVSSGDATSQTVLSKEEIAQNVLSGAKRLDHAVILLHQTKSKLTTAQALPAIIEGLNNMGFTFAALSMDGFCPQFVAPITDEPSVVAQMME